MDQKHKLFDLASLMEADAGRTKLTNPIVENSENIEPNPEMALGFKNLLESMFKEPADNTEVLSSINSKLDKIINLLEQIVNK